MKHYFNCLLEKKIFTTFSNLISVKNIYRISFFILVYRHRKPKEKESLSNGEKIIFLIKDCFTVLLTPLCFIFNMIFRQSLLLRAIH